MNPPADQIGRMFQVIWMKCSGAPLASIFAQGTNHI
jgi:rhamnose utilization protein RhaD (predicted bifunctional aldolase and dehydrogenase)